ncbi:MAG: hypothetical protein LC794_10555 [Acidobacteria bacterium]|nr:hypothetical protein [Acidobacteriota bacterium]
MAPDDHDTHGGHQPSPQNVSPAPLLNDATATIYLDGLIYAVYNENRRVLESAILTKAEDHHLVIEVRLRGHDELLWPKQSSDWDPDHAAVDAGAPFWLYVDSGNRIKEDEFSARLHTGNRTFQSIFDFEGHHGKPLPLKPGTFAVFNFPHGTSYSAVTNSADLKLIPANGSVATAKDQGKIEVSNLAGIDINAVSNGAEKKFIVLANQDGKKEFFRFELEPGKQYEIKILNQPVPNSAPNGDHEAHFLQFYELFDVDPETVPRFLVIGSEHDHGGGSHPEGGEPPADPPSADNPPCAPGRGGSTTGLGGG